MIFLCMIFFVEIEYEFGLVNEEYKIYVVFVLISFFYLEILYEIQVCS